MTTILLYTEGHAQTGFGHLIRCLALADELTRHGAHCMFMTKYGTPGHRMIVNAGFDCKLYADQPGLGFDTEPALVIQRLLSPQISHGMYRAVVFDLQGGVTPELLRTVPDDVQKVVLCGPGYYDTADGAVYADKVFYPLLHRLNRRDWNGFQGAKYGGPEYAILRPEFGSTDWHPVTTPRIFVAGGAADPHGIILKVLRALDVLAADFAFDVMASRLYRDMDELCRFKPQHMMEVHIEPRDPWRILSGCACAVVSFGVTAMECMAVGLPTATLAISADHNSAADELAARGGLFNFGPVDETDDDTVRYVVNDWLTLHRMGGLEPLSRKARLTVDGRGVQRVAARILEAVDAQTH